MAAKETDAECKYPTTFIDDAGTSAKAALKVVKKFGALKASVLPFDRWVGEAQRRQLLEGGRATQGQGLFQSGGKQPGKPDRFKNGWRITDRS
jgi:hypothetical protein